MMKKYLPLAYILMLILVLLFAAMNRGELPARSDSTYVLTGAMRLPANYREHFTLYMTVDRPDATVRLLYIRSDVLENLDPTASLPYGTQIIIETYHARTDSQGNLLHDDNGHLLAGEMFPNIHMMEKRNNWTIEELPSPVGIIDWNFASFVAETSLPSDENRNDCLTCHDTNAFRRDLTFSRSLIDRFKATDEIQYLFCNRNNRGNCIP